MTFKKAKKDIKGLILSDIHFGHRNTPTEHIIASIEKLINNPELLKEIDIIWFSGDVFERGLELNDPNVAKIFTWWVALAKLCKEYDVLVVFLYGTPGHDKRQSVYFILLNELCKLHADVVYVSELSIQYIDKLDIHVLYIPDRARSNSSIAWRDVKRLLADRKLDQVDVAITHGFFDFQVPEMARHNIDHHISEDYSKIVKYAIFNGHDHTPKHALNIWVPGSTDRLRHGEEEDKGILKFHIYGDGIKVDFIKNHHAMKYLTFRLANEPLEEVVSLIDDKAKHDPMAFIRILASRESSTFHLGEQLEKLYPKYRFTFEEPATEKNKSVNAIAKIIDTSKSLSNVSLTKENLRDELIARVDDAKPEYVDLAKYLLNGVLHDE